MCERCKNSATRTKPIFMEHMHPQIRLKLVGPCAGTRSFGEVQEQPSPLLPRDDLRRDNPPMRYRQCQKTSQPYPDAWIGVHG